MGAGRRSLASLLVLVFTVTLIPIAVYWTDAWPRLTLAWSTSRVQEPIYQVQVFSIDPVILYIKDFLSKDEISHILKIA
jgi:hypothetical protein